MSPTTDLTLKAPRQHALMLILISVMALGFAYAVSLSTVGIGARLGSVRTVLVIWMLLIGIWAPVVLLLSRLRVLRIAGGVVQVHSGLRWLTLGAATNTRIQARWKSQPRFVGSTLQLEISCGEARYVKLVGADNFLGGDAELLRQSGVEVNLLGSVQT